MRLGVQPQFSLAEAASIAGVNYRTLQRHGERGLIEIRTRGGRYSIDRHELIRYLKAHGYPQTMWRPAFQPTGGHLIFLQPATDLPSVNLSGCGPEYCRSVLALGRRLAEAAVWAVVIDFLGVGRSAAIGLAAEMRLADAPLLVAVTADDEAERSSQDLRDFDLLVARPVHVPGFVAGLNMLRRSVEQLSPGPPTAGGVQRRRQKRVTHA